MNTLSVPQVYSENQLFAQGVQAGEFTFLAQDARGADGSVGEFHSAWQQAQRILSNLDAALLSTGQSLENPVSLSVFLPDYSDSEAVTNVLRSTFTTTGAAINIIGVCALEGNCRVRMDALASTNHDRETIAVAGVPPVDGLELPCRAGRRFRVSLRH